MGAFAITFIVLTGIYFIVISGMLLYDVFKSEPGNKEDIEKFVVSDEDDESVTVHETEGGYSFGDDDITEELFNDAPSEGGVQEGTVIVTETSSEKNTKEVEENPFDERPTDTEDSGADDEEDLEAESQESLAFFENLKALRERMEDVDSFYQEELLSDEFAVALAQPISKKSRILRNIVQS